MTTRDKITISILCMSAAIGIMLLALSLKQGIPQFLTLTAAMINSWVAGVLIGDNWESVPFIKAGSNREH